MKTLFAVSLLLVLVAVSSVQSTQYFVTRYYSDSQCGSSVLSKTVDTTELGNCFQVGEDFRQCTPSNQVLTCVDANCTLCTVLASVCEVEVDGNSNSMKSSCETSFTTSADDDLEVNGGGWYYAYNDSTCTQIDSAVYYNPECIQYEGGSGIYYCEDNVFQYTDCVGSSSCSGSCKTYRYANDQCSKQDNGVFRTAFCGNKSNSSSMIGISSMLVAAMFILSFLF
jgi:hypothetical protein